MRPLPTTNPARAADLLLRPSLAILDLFPTASVFYLGLFREKVSLQPVEYYQKLPAHPTVDTLFLLDPLVATGGTAIAAVSMLVRPHSSPLLSSPTPPKPPPSHEPKIRKLTPPQLDWGLQISNIKLLVLLGSKPGLDAVASACPGLEIFVGGVDDQVRSSRPRDEGLGADLDARAVDGGRDDFAWAGGQWG